MNAKQIRLVAHVGIAVCLLGGSTALAATVPPLGTAQTFAVLGGSTVTNTGSSVITGDLGVWPGLAITGFPPGVVFGTTHAGDAVALQAQSDLVVAYNDLAGQACDMDLTGSDLGGMTLPAGSYCFSTSAQLTGTLTLDAQGDPDAVFLFQIGSTLTTASGAVVEIIGGGSECNVFWQVGSSATLGTGSTVAGSILALTSITLDTSASVSGQLLARNGAVTLDTNTVSLCIAACPLITLSPATLPTGVQPGVFYSVTISATGGAAPYTYMVTDGILPPGLALDPVTGVLSGIPTAEGTWVFTITATDADGCPGTAIYTITINPLQCPTLTILPPVLPNAAVNVPYSEAITAGGSTPDTYVFTVSAGLLPPGLALNPTTPPPLKTVNLSGTPTVAGNYSFTITATDADNCLVSQAYAMLVNPLACPTITLSPTVLPNPVVGVPYSQTISATGGRAPYTYAVTAGALPADLTLNAVSGVISGVPTIAGDYYFTITATDADNCPGSQDYSMQQRVLPHGIPALSVPAMIILMSVLALAGLFGLRRLAP